MKSIVELVIVIAIIAILAAVLIPTFASLIQKANESKDTQLVRNLNTALKTDGKEHKTMQDALDAAEAFGYDVGKINASATDNEILWDSVNDAFCYFDKGNGIKYLPESNATAPADYLLWKIYNNQKDLDADNQKYSIYWNNAAAPKLDELKVGFDAGNCTTVTSLTYVGNSAAQKVVIRTNGGTLTVNAANDSVSHYGFASTVKVEAVDKNSYHLFGVVKEASIKSGRFVVEGNGFVGVLNGETGADVEVKGEVNVFVGTALDASKVTGYVGHNGSADASSLGTLNNVSVTIASVQDMYAFKYQVESGRTFSGVTVNLTADLDLGEFEPIGTMTYMMVGPGAAVANFEGSAYFSGIFNGNNHTLTYSASNIESDYGLFMVIGSEDKDNYAEVKNLKMNVNLTAKAGDRTFIGGLADIMTGYVKISDCEVSGTIASTAAASGFVGWYAGNGFYDDISFVRCTNKADITVTLGETDTKYALVGGICSQVGSGVSKDENQNDSTRYIYTFEDCKNEGTLTLIAGDNASAKLLGEIIGQGQAYGTAKITNCTKKDASNKWIGKGRDGYTNFKEEITPAN